MSRKIFISYRRSDSADFTVALYNELCALYGEDFVFKDINAIQPGQHFGEALQGALNDCAVVLVVIGPQWVVPHGKRLFEEQDWVRLEIAQALSRNLRVVPILVNGTLMPETAHLPPDLHGLCKRQALTIDNQHFDYDVAKLCQAIHDLVPSRKPPLQGQASAWDHAFKGILLLFMLASITLITWAWLGSNGSFAEKIVMSLLGLGGMAGGWAAFTRQRWIELRANQLEKR